jgi:cysteine desulfurase/selenocysteine lyase
MSTSDQDRASSADRMQTDLPAGLPDVAMLTRMANEFFRAQPEQAASAPDMPSMPAFETRLPEMGMPLPSVPAIPSSGQMPLTSQPPAMTELSPFSVGPAAAMALPAAAPGRQAGMAPTQTTPFTNLSSRPEGSAVEGPAVFPHSAPSPFAMPMPQFGATFPSFETGVPAIPALPPLRTGDEARSLPTDSSAFYFLEHAGGPRGTEIAGGRPALADTSRFYFLDGGGLHATPAPTDPAVGDLKLPRNQFDLGSVRRDFPILREQVNGHPLIWLDNAATTQKPQSVIDRISYFYEHENSNIHRAAHELAARATDAYEDARTKVAHFLNASSSKEIVFARGATEAINLVAQAWGRRHINKGDEIVISWIEHHANIVPWQMLCAEKGACLRVAPVDDDGQILLDEYEKLLSPKTRLVSFTQVSNALGTVTPAHQMVQMAHRYGARVLLDGAQAVSHMPIDVQSLDCDFYVFSGHKVFAPTGIGVLYGKPEVLAETPPWQGGGNMIIDVTFEKTTYQPPPGRFEAGTGNIADAVGLGAAVDYLEHLGMPNVARHEHELMVYATREMMRVPGLRMIGTAKEKAGVLSFVLDGYRTEEVGAALNREGIAVRSGHHCAQPTLRRFGLETTVRPSLAVYNSYEDIDAMVAALFRLKRQGV